MRQALVISLAVLLALTGCTAVEQNAQTPTAAAPTQMPGQVPPAQAPAAGSSAGLGSPTPAQVAAAGGTAATPAASATGAPATTPTTQATGAPAVTPTASAAAPAATATPVASPPLATATAVAATSTRAPAEGGGASSGPVPGQASGPLPGGVTLQPVAQGLTAPVTLVPAPDNSGRLFVVDQAGLIHIISPDGKLLPAPFLDLRDRMVQLSAGYDERGLLGLAFHPDFAHNQRLFVYYSAPLRQGGPAGFDNTEHLSEFKVAAGNPNQADPASERVLLQVDHPQPNHNGGTLVFGPDGFLYMGIGDGGGANDADNGHTPGLGNAQDTSKLLGKILRIDVNSGNPYGIPKDNPFASGGGAPEIYAYGLRNPYRFSFDLGGNHQLYAGDVGQNLFEEVDILQRGGNYGWHIREGFHCFSPASPNQPPASCPQTGARGEPLLNPILEYTHPDPGIAIIGGYVYRGRAVPALAGRYVFGDWSTSFGAPDGTLLVAQAPANGQGAWQFQKLAVAGGRLGHYLLGLGQDGAGELYVLTSDRGGPAGNTGQVFKIAAAQ